MGKKKEIIVQKYGGSSVATVEKIKRVARNIVAYKKRGFSVVSVVSALGDTTDELISLAAKITKHPQEREFDMLISTGEQVSSALLTMAIHDMGFKAISFTGFQVGIITDGVFTKARIVKINADRIKSELKKDKIVVVAGFQGVNLNMDITTLGRGGSDLTAVALTKSLNADVCEIYTDVKGVYTADPRIVKEAKKISKICYDEMLEMASLGAQVMQARSIEFAKKNNVKIHVRSSSSRGEGTMIMGEVKGMEDIYVSGVAIDKKEAKVTICDVPDKPGIAALIFSRISGENINVDMIVQNISRKGYTDLSFTVPKTDLTKTVDIAKLVASEIKSTGVTVDNKIAKISVIGVGMRSHAGIAAEMFQALADNKINIEMISTSEIKISCVINVKHADEAVRILHRVFKLHNIKR
ncbi:MAG: aspartate kinase [Candidatus Kaelpia aquatica]|nr:aspartate kinase [Candidatus Kaelpia aquatica]